MNKVERIQMVKAMEFIARSVNNEDFFYDLWLVEGVADGDIERGDLTVRATDIEPNSNLEYYTEDENFASLMRLFLDLMHEARKDGGLYCDDTVSL